MLSLTDIGIAIQWPAHFDMIYLDPLMCKLAWSKTSASSPAEKAADQLMRQIRSVLGSPPDETVGYLDGNGFGTRFKDDRQRQRKMAQILDKLPAGLRQFSTVSALQKDKKALREYADHESITSLMVVDGALAVRRQTPPDIATAVDDANGLVRERERGMELLMADFPAPVLTLYDQFIGLKINLEAFWHWTPAFSAILSPGWYPFARMIGLYATVPGGQGYFNVLAVLVRPHPSLDQVLPMVSDETSGQRTPGLLETTLDNELRPSVEAFKGAKEASEEPAWNGYEREKTLLVPPHMLKVCCELNRVNWRGLQARAPQAYQVIGTYLAQLGELSKCLEARKIESLIRHQQTEVPKFLKEPEEIVNAARPPARL